MPRLEGIEDKELFGMKVDKEDDNTIYNDEKHLYVSKKDGTPYISVTTLVSRYCVPFDSLFWASYKACEWFLDYEFGELKNKLLQTKRWKDSYLEEYDIDEVEFLKKRDEILKSYEDKKNAATTRGTVIHSQFENLFYQKDNTIINKYTNGGKFDCKKGYNKLDLERAIYPELLISYEFDEWLKVAGQCDIILKDGNDIIIGDFKTNKKIEKESYFDKNTKKRQMMLAPLNNLQDSTFNHYQLQLSIYAYILQKINPKFNIKKLIIIHIDHDNNITEMECEYLKDDVARLLLDFRKKQKIKSQLDLDKPIIF